MQHTQKGEHAFTLRFALLQLGQAGDHELLVGCCCRRCSELLRLVLDHEPFQICIPYNIA